MSTEPADSGPLVDRPPPVGWSYILVVALANLGIWFALFAHIANLLPRQVASISGGQSKISALGAVIAIGALVALLINPIVGTLSDRTVSRIGRRRPWVLGGILLGVPSLIALPGQHTVLGLTVTWGCAQAAINMAYAALTASIPDQVPAYQRGLVSGWMGLTQALSLVLGIAVVTQVAPDLIDGNRVTTIVFAVLTFSFVAKAPDVKQMLESRPAISLKLLKFLASLANSMATLYLLYYLNDAVHYPRPNQGQLELSIISVTGVLLTVVAGGQLSDRIGRRKPFVIWSAVLMSLAFALLAVWETWTSALVASTMLGLGYGVYLAVDQALITQVLPTTTDRGRDLGILNIANTAPQVLAPALAVPLVSAPLGYRGLYLAISLITLLGAILVRQIEGVE